MSYLGILKPKILGKVVINLRKLFIISAAAVTLAAVLMSAAISNDTNETAESTSQSARYTESREALYVMKTYEGKIGVFTPDNAEPLYTLEDVHLKSLPQYDQSMLKTGIKIYSEKELQSLIEDYDS